MIGRDAGASQAERELDADIPIADVRTVDDVLAAATAQARFSIVLLATAVQAPGGGLS